MILLCNSSYFHHFNNNSESWLGQGKGIASHLGYLHHHNLLALLPYFFHSRPGNTLGTSGNTMKILGIDTMWNVNEAQAGPRHSGWEGWGWDLLMLLLTLSSFKEIFILPIFPPHNPRLSMCYRLKSILTKYAFNSLLLRQLLYK